MATLVLGATTDEKTQPSESYFVLMKVVNLQDAGFPRAPSRCDGILISGASIQGPNNSSLRFPVANTRFSFLVSGGDPQPARARRDPREPRRRPPGPAPSVQHGGRRGAHAAGGAPQALQQGLENAVLPAFELFI